MTLMSFGLIGFALVKGDVKLMSANRDEDKASLFDHDNGYRDGLSGYGHYINGMRVDE
ncbi:hypothetical protein [Pseudomonas aeruginosa]|nr:hypothetical protein [Pseudomonas aeruginosa]